MALILNFELALAEGVPELDGLIAGSGNNLAVVGAEADAENILFVAHKALGGQTGVEVPQSAWVEKVKEVVRQEKSEAHLRVLSQEAERAN